MELQLLAIVFLLLALQTTGYADPKLPFAIPPGTPVIFNEVQYDYRYAVDDPKSGVINDKWEQRYGEYVKGAYSVLEPDGKIRTVDYEVDGPRGFHAVIRTHNPSTKLLSIIQLHKSQQSAENPPVNILTDQELDPETIPLPRRPRVLQNDLPVNFHSISPNYYLSLVPGQRTRYRSKTAGGHATFIAGAPDNSDTQDLKLRQDDDAAPRSNQPILPVRDRNGVTLPSQYVLPPRTSLQQQPAPIRTIQERTAQVLPKRTTRQQNRNPSPSGAQSSRASGRPTYYGG